MFRNRTLENVREAVYHDDGGIRSYVEHLNANKEPIKIHQSLTVPTILKRYFYRMLCDIFKCIVIENY